MEIVIGLVMAVIIGLLATLALAKLISVVTATVVSALPSLFLLLFILAGFRLLTRTLFK